MLHPRWLIVVFTTSVVVTGFIACNSDSVTTTSSNAGDQGTGGTSTTDTTSTASGATGGSGGMATLTCGVEYTNVPTGDCDLLNQNCAPGETCNAEKGPGAMWTTVCVPAYGLKQRGEVC